jgi:hypothetical protein
VQQRSALRWPLLVPSGGHALPLAPGINVVGHYFRYFGSSGVRALPFAARVNIGGHYCRYFSTFLFVFLLVLPPLLKFQKGLS